MAIGFHKINKEEKTICFGEKRKTFLFFLSFFFGGLTVDLMSSLAEKSPQKMNDCSNYRQAGNQEERAIEPLDTLINLTAFTECFYPKHFTIYLSFRFPHTKCVKLKGIGERFFDVWPGVKLPTC